MSTHWVVHISRLSTYLVIRFKFTLLMRGLVMGGVFFNSLLLLIIFALKTVIGLDFGFFLCVIGLLLLQYLRFQQLLC